jgi:opacity protein-like surface antigen
MGIMNIRKKSYLVGLLGLSSIAIVAHATQPGAYVGVQVGSTNTNNIAKPVQTGVANPPTVLLNPNNKGIGERFFVGGVINKYAAIELGFTHYGTSTYTPAPEGLSGTPSIQENGVDFVGKAIYPIKDFSVFAKAGISFIRQSPSGSLKPISGDAPSKKQHTGPIAGVGASYDLNPNWVTDVTWTRAFKGGGGFGNADMLALGISYHWVDKYCGQFLC